jgi:hypothetical protein
MYTSLAVHKNLAAILGNSLRDCGRTDMPGLPDNAWPTRGADAIRSAYGRTNAQRLFEELALSIGSHSTWPSVRWRTRSVETGDA